MSLPGTIECLLGYSQNKPNAVSVENAQFSNAAWNIPEPCDGCNVFAIKEEIKRRRIIYLGPVHENVAKVGNCVLDAKT